MRRLAVLPLAFVALNGASAPGAAPVATLDAALDAAQAEQTAAEAQAAALERHAKRARGTAMELARRQAAAARQIEVAEARITTADLRYRLLGAAIDLQQRRLASEQRPAAALIAGIALMGERPPILSIIDRGGTDELVEVRALLDTTLPVIRERTAALAGALDRAQGLQRSAAAARRQLVLGREALAQRREAYAALERQAVARANDASGRALSSGDSALAAAETVDRLGLARANAGAIRSAAAGLAAEAPPPWRPVAIPRPRAAFAYRLPADAPVLEGLYAVNASGVRSRGITLATARGDPVTVPANGVVRFAGPFREHDGVVIIEHGQGWFSLLLNVASRYRAGDRVRAGEPLGRASGPLGVELSQNGRRVSPAIIAGSSAALSNAGKAS